MDIYTVREELLTILNNIDSLQEQLDDIRASKPEGWKEDEEALLMQVDAYEDTIESLEWDLSEIVQELVKDIKNLTAKANAFKAEKDKFACKERWAKERIDRENDILMWLMKSYGERKVECDLWDVSIRKNGGFPGIELTCEPDKLPERFRVEKTEYKLDLYQARQALDAGEENLPFRYKPQGEHIVIR